MDGARRRRFIVVAALLPVALFVVVEAALRVAGVAASEPPIRFLGPERGETERARGIFVADPVLFWRLNPGWQAPRGEPIPESGFRSAFEKKKASGVRRVACLGSSNTFGMWVPKIANVWPSVLCVDLASGRPTERWEPLDLGVPGYSSWQVRRLLETEVGEMSPDLVVAETGAFNEWVPALGAVDRAQGVAPDWTRSRVVELLARTFARDPTGDAAPRRFEDLKTADFTGPRRVPLADYEDDLRAIVRWCAERRAPLIFVAEPLPAKTVERNPIALEYASTLRRVAAETNTPLADAWASFRASGLSDAELFRDFVHPTETGHRLIAETVLPLARSALPKR